MDSITLLLPTIWAIVATLIGILLYKSSDALFEQTKKSATTRRRLRLTGAAAIAAFAFIAMKWATPQERLTVTTVAVHRNLDELDRATLEAQAAIASHDERACKNALERVATAARALRVDLYAVPGMRR